MKGQQCFEYDRYIREVTAQIKVLQITKMRRKKIFINLAPFDYKIISIDAVETKPIFSRTLMRKRISLKQISHTN